MAFNINQLCMLFQSHLSNKPNKSNNSLDEFNVVDFNVAESLPFAGRYYLLWQVCMALCSIRQGSKARREKF